MKKSLLILALLITGQAFATDSYGVGTLSCAKYASVYSRYVLNGDASAGIEYLQFLSWVQGFVSGANALAGKDRNAGGIDFDVFNRQIFDLCEKQPSAALILPTSILLAAKMAPQKSK